MYKGSPHKEIDRVQQRSFCFELYNVFRAFEHFVYSSKLLQLFKTV